MSGVHKIFLIMHLVSAFFWLVSLNFMVLLIDYLWEKFDLLKPLVNFRNDLNLLCQKILNIVFVAIILSGTGLMIIGQKNIYEGFYAVAFFTKLALLIMVYFISLPFLKIPLRPSRFQGGNNFANNEGSYLELVQVRKIDLRKWLLPALSIAIVAISVWVR